MFKLLALAGVLQTIVEGGGATEERIKWWAEESAEEAKAWKKAIECTSEGVFAGPHLHSSRVFEKPSEIFEYTKEYGGRHYVILVAADEATEQRNYLSTNTKAFKSLAEHGFTPRILEVAAGCEDQVLVMEGRPWGTMSEGVTARVPILVIAAYAVHLLKTLHDSGWIHGSIEMDSLVFWLGNDETKPSLKLIRFGRSKAPKSRRDDLIALATLLLEAGGYAVPAGENNLFSNGVSGALSRVRPTQKVLTDFYRYCVSLREEAIPDYDHWITTFQGSSPEKTKSK